MKWSTIIALVLISLVISGCSLYPVESLTRTSRPTDLITTTPEPTLFETIGQEASVTINVPTFQQKPVLASSPTVILDVYSSTPVIESKKVEFDSSIKPMLYGTLIIRSRGDDGDYFLLNLGSLQKIPLTTLASEDANIRVPDFSVSPNREYLAYFELTDGDEFKYDLLVISASGEGLQAVNFPNDLGALIGWLDNENIAFTKQDYTGTTHILNPFNGTEKEILPTFLDPSEKESLVTFFCGNPYYPFPYAVYNSDFSKAVYMISLDKSSVYRYVDIQTGELLWEANTGLFSSKPIWSPNNASFAVIYDEYTDKVDPYHDSGNLVVINQEGEVLHQVNNVAGCASWSPNGRYITAWWRGETDFRELSDWSDLLAIFDTKTNVVSVYPIGNAGADQYPIWSPDSRMVTIVSYRDTYEPVNDVSTQVVILDVIDNQLFSVIDEFTVVGWMIP